jgi:hypothetical protein
MNPFAQYHEYDYELSEILENLNKKTPKNTYESLKNLLEYLPNVNFNSDLAVIKKTLKNFIFQGNQNIKAISNRILYEILQRNGSKSFEDIKDLWIYNNLEGMDQYTKKILEKHFKIDDTKFYGLLSFKEDPVRDLQCYLYLLKNTSKDFPLDVSKIRLDNYSDFLTIDKILKIIKKGSKLYWDIFQRIKTMKNSFFYNSKYGILLNHYNYIDQNVYEEARYLDQSNFKKILEYESLPESEDHS